ncbi:MAG TPA: hypothetical protein VHE53_04380 [Patescibacteria group bacterium]|nr:hypothetical protein [Patescibacteria group bacterium]
MNQYAEKQLEETNRIEDNFKSGNSPSQIVDPVDDYANDNRLCLTSIVFLPNNITQKINSEILQPLKKLDERQYFFLPESMHITINNIRVINDPPHFTEEEIEKVKEVFRNVVSKHKSINFDLKGLWDLPTSLAIKAFTDESFGNLVMELREELNNAGVPDDKSYGSNEVVIGSSTIIRYTTKPNELFFQKIKELKDIEIGEVNLSEIKLITTNAVNHPSKTKIIESYKLS